MVKWLKQCFVSIWIIKIKKPICFPVTNIKKYSVGSPIQASVEALTKIIQRTKLKAADVKSFESRVPGYEVVNNRSMPDINIQYCLAATMLDGTLTLQTMLRRTSLDAYQALRVLWALACVGAVALTPEPHDVATIPRRLLVDIRSHLRARANRLMASTFYDVLEIPPAAEQAEIEAAFQLVARRYAPPILAQYDLSDLASQVQPQWDVTEKARAVLLDNAARGRYHDWIREKGAALRTIWAVPAAQSRQAAEAFGRGQKALGDGDVHKAMSELAAACRAQPGHPEYETNLAWARYRVEVNAGKDRDTVARRERATVEDTLWGLRPWPRALLALAMLCAACSDPDAARWYLRQALEVDPTMPAGLQLWQRLAGTRR